MSACGCGQPRIAAILRPVSVADVFRRKPRNRWLNLPIVVVAIAAMYVGPRFWISSEPWQYAWLVVVCIVAIVAMYVADWAWERRATRRSI